MPTKKRFLKSFTPLENPDIYDRGNSEKILIPYKKDKVKVSSFLTGFTLIELITVITVIVIISVTGAYLMAYLVQNSVFIPNKLNVDMIGQDLMDIIIEGDQLAKGLRFAASISRARDARIVFRNLSGQGVVFLWNASNKKIYRIIDNGAREVIPYYLPEGIFIEQKDSASIFTYYDINENDTNNANNVRRVRIEFTVRSGSGDYKDWQAKSVFLSSIAVRKFE